MWQIKKEFDDQSQMNGKGMVFLKADKILSPYHITFPITWSGFISNNKVEIIQTNSSVTAIEDIVFKVYPEKYSYLKKFLLDWIHHYLRVLN